MKPSLTFAKEAFSRFNSLIFKSALPVPAFRLTNARTFRGKLCYTHTTRAGRRICSDFEMRLSLDFDLPTTEWEDVIIHEMIHLQIAAKGIRDSSSHGPVFRTMMEQINRNHGRHIVISSKSTEQQLDQDKRIRGHYICLTRFNDGRLGVAPVAKSRIFELWDAFAGWSEINSVSWIGTVDPWFNRFPRVMKTKVYISTREELLPHLKGAMRLQRNGDSIRAVRTTDTPTSLLP